MKSSKLAMGRTFIIFISCLFMAIGQLYSQVGVNTENPNILTELDVHNLLRNGTDTIPKGIMIPRMTEAQRNQIDLSNPKNANSVMIYNISEDCYNYYSRTEGEWKSICGDLGKSQFDFDCAAVVVLGTYIEKKELTPSINRLKFFVTVTKPGSYSITGTTSNGYYFETSGVFLAAGTFTVYAEGNGTPQRVQTDIVNLTKNGEAVNCATPVKVNVLSATATYSINCSSLVATGRYVKGTALTTANTITLSVNVSSTGSYSITTPLTNGISFSSSGNFNTTGTQLVTLIGTGTPTVNIDFPITVNTDSPLGNTTCNVIIPMTLPKMTYGIIGSGDYSWASSQRQSALTNGGVSFGPNGIVRIVSFTQLWTASSAAAGVTNLSNAVKPDVILYFAFGAAPTTALSLALADYINKGGCVIYGTTDNGFNEANNLLGAVFGTGVAPAVNISAFTGSGNITDDNDYMIANLPNDPVINGPFGNVSARYWGEDNAGSVIVTQLPPNSVQICSANSIPGKSYIDPVNSIVWYNDTKNFLYFGDSVASSTSNNASDGWPAIYNSSGFPQSKRYGPGTGLQFVYNSALELNAVAWAIKKAAVSGINSH